MGTPHRGSEVASWASMVQQIAKTVMLSQSFRRELLKNLKYNSEILGNISRQFVPHTVSFPIRTFYEQEITPPLTTLVWTYLSNLCSVLITTILIYLLSFLTDCYAGVCGYEY